jgi:outer membrane protein OmpA-like peptidoglycan-associated protein/tetratricopeptide (TPR) repeat protein
MYQKIYSSFLIFLCSFLFSIQLSAQSKTVIAKIDKADKFFLINDFANALPLYLDLDKTESKDALTNYRIGICYFNLSQKDKALPYFEYALSHKSENVPDKVYQYAGQLYHLSYQFDEAIQQFATYKKALEKAKAKTTEIGRQIEISRNAGLLLKDTLNVFIQNVGSPINTAFTEYGPVISADESTLIYTTLKPNAAAKKNGSSANTEYEDISIAYRKDIGVYSTPVSIGLNTKTNIGSVGLSPDGQHLLIYMGGQTNNGDIYSCSLQGEKWANPVKLSSKINSTFQESSASLTPDQKTLYFASNRPGGLGGSDIYVVHKTSTGEWSEPVNMGSAINTPYDEDSPFIHPDGKTLYFSSTGHNTMGGSDIFKATLNGKNWSVPANMGFPINTVYDDNYFVLSADGKKGYYSSNRPGGAGGGDIYFLGIPEEQGVIPLTMMKGRIITGNKQVPTKIKVIDKQSNEVINNVYDPNIKTGNYLIIFPPGKSYDMIIEAEGYMPYLVNICVPNQNYFYELYQEIHMKSIVQAGKQIGQEISVKNVFYDIEKDSTLFDPSKFGSNNLDLYDLMDNVIAASDSTALNYLLDIMYNEKSVDLTNVAAEPLTGTYYYDDAQGRLQPVVINGDTIYTLPAFKVVGDQITKAEPVIAEVKQQITKETVIEPNKTYIIYFDTDKTTLKTDAMPELEKVYSYLKNNTSYGIKIAGYADADGSDERNKLISDNRAKAVAKYLSAKGITYGRITAKGYGQVPEAKKNESEQDKKLHRKAEIMMVELTK